MLTSIFQQQQEQFEKLVGILNLDVFEYFSLKNQYNTDAKKTAFRESEDFRAKYLNLEKVRADLLTVTWYLDFEPDYLDEKSISIRYDPETKSYAVSNNVSLGAYYDKPGYLQFDHLLFRCPSGMTISKRNVNYACVDVVEQTISFIIDDESEVSKIEQNRNSLRLLFIFRFTGISQLPGKESNLISSDFYLLTELQKVVVYNTLNNEIYNIY